MSRTIRKLPTGNRRYFHRHPRTMNELKAVAASTCEGVHVRAKRTKRHLPNAWDDISIAAMSEVVDKTKAA